MEVLRYIELNPVRAGLVRYAHQWGWSSAGAHVRGREDKLVKADVFGMTGGEWQEFLLEGTEDDQLRRIRRHVTRGRPMGSDAFVDRVERMLKRTLRPGKPGPKSASKR